MCVRGGDSTSDCLWIFARNRKKKKNTSRPQPALKGETKTGIDVKKGCWTAAVGRPAFGKSSQICR